MALTEAQKQKINEEEEYRATLRNTHAQEKRSIGCLPALLIIFFVSLVFYGVYSSLSVPSSGYSGNTPTIAPKPDLDGKVNFDGTQVHITNNESDVWTKCWFSVNSDYTFPTDAPYSVTEDIQSGDTFNINIGDFTKKDGQRFNAFQYKPQHISASCDGRFGYWEW